MKARRYIIERLLTAVLVTVLLSGCSLIDDEPGECGYKERYELDYELELVTNRNSDATHGRDGHQCRCCVESSTL